MVARLDANSEAAEGQELELWLDMDRVHLFDAKDGPNLQNPTGTTGEIPARSSPRSRPVAWVAPVVVGIVISTRRR